MTSTVRANDPIDHTTNADPIVVHEDHHVPVPIPAQVAEEAPIHRNLAEAEIAARPPGAQQDGVPVVGLGQNEPQATQTAALYRQPGPPYPPADAGVIKAVQPPGDDEVQLVEGINNRDLYALVRSFNAVSSTRRRSVDTPADKQCSVSGSESPRKGARSAHDQSAQRSLPVGHAQVKL